MKSHINGISTPPSKNRTVLIIDAQHTENQEGKKSQISIIIFILVLSALPSRHNISVGFYNRLKNYFLHYAE